ncbi:MAG: hypothetical protein ACM3MK_13080 [Chitinophagales bacterium]
MTKARMIIDLKMCHNPQQVKIDIKENIHSITIELNSKKIRTAFQRQG